MRKIGRRIDQQLREHQLKVLAGLLSTAKTEDEILAVLNIVMTPSEKAAIAQRLAIILRVQKGSMYYDLELMFGTSPTTIAKAVSQYLKHGSDNEIFNQLTREYHEPKFVQKANPKIVDPLFKSTKDSLKFLKQ